MSQRMEIVHLKRSLLWSKELATTLLDFWMKHPEETPAVFRFVGKKAVAFPKFLSKNVMTEKYTKSYDEELFEVATLYERLKDTFDPSDPKSYKRLEKLLSDKLQILYFLIRKTKPNIVVETGVAHGESTGYLLQALHDNGKGKLYSIDLPFQWYVYGDHELHLDSLPPGKQPGYLVPKSLKKNWTLILGDTYKELPKLIKRLKNIDIFIHDSEHSDKTMTFEYVTAWPTLRKGSYLCSDDVNFTKAFQNFAKANKKVAIDFKHFGIMKK